MLHLIQGYCAGNSFCERWFGGTENKQEWLGGTENKQEWLGGTENKPYSSTTADQRDAR